MQRGSRVTVAVVAFALIGMLILALTGMRVLAPADFGFGTNARGRLDDIRRKGFLTCGIWPQVAGFSEIDAQGLNRGLDVDMCRAVAVAILGPEGSTRFVEAETVDAFIRSRDIDMVSRRLTWELKREGSLGLLFGPIMFYDGQGFLVPRRSAVTSVAQLSGQRICVEPGTRSDFTYELYFRAHKFDLKKVSLASSEDLSTAFAGGTCQAYTADVSMLGALRSKMPDAADFAILAEQISKEPLAQLVRKGDDQFFDILRWSVFATIRAEELGVTSGNVDEMLESDDLEVKRLLGVIPGNGQALGLDERWAFNVIKAVGNYGEIFERNVGSRSRLKMERGLNRLWTFGGLMYAPPLR